MSVEITCPVCERSQIAGNVCPNCETDLSIYRMLAELPVKTPVATKKQKRTIPIWFPIGVAVLFLLIGLGLGLGFAGDSVIAKQEKQITPNTNIYSSKPTQLEELTTPIIVDKPIKSKIGQSELKSCGGFNYVMQKGDSLSLIASRFYGDINSWFLISEANPKIQGRESLIKVNELLVIPNLEDSCING